MGLAGTFPRVVGVWCRAWLVCVGVGGQVLVAWWCWVGPVRWLGACGVGPLCFVLWGWGQPFGNIHTIAWVQAGRRYLH